MSDESWHTMAKRLEVELEATAERERVLLAQVEQMRPVIDRRIDSIHPVYGHSGEGDDCYIDNTKPERDHFQGNCVFLDEIHELAIAIDALAPIPPTPENTNG